MDILTSKAVPSREERVLWKPFKHSHYKDDIGCLLAKHWKFDDDQDGVDEETVDDLQLDGSTDDQVRSNPFSANCSKYRVKI